MKQADSTSSSFDELRRRIASQRGEALWRSLEEVAATPQYLEALQREFPAPPFLVANPADDQFSRRSFLYLIGASLALAGAGGLVGGCSDKPEDARIMPYVDAPEALVPGKPLFFATAMPMNGYAKGVIVQSREGRPIKIEGNPDHPASVGGTDVFMQASILMLYDPDRAKVVTFGGEANRWGAFWQTFRSRMDQMPDGDGLYVLASPSTSPTLAAQRRTFVERFPGARWHQYDPLMRLNAAAGARQSFGRPLEAYYDLSKAQTILSLESDFLFDEPGSVRYALQFANGRRVRVDPTNPAPARVEMNRLYVAEAQLSITGSMADHRLALAPERIAKLALAVASACGVAVDLPADASYSSWTQAVARDLMQHRGRSLVIAGQSQPPEVHVLAHALNYALGNVGQTVFYVDPICADPADGENSLAALVEDMRAGRVKTLLILGGNPAYTATADVEFAKELARLSTEVLPDGGLANLTAHFGLFEDETSFCCQWHLPQTHYLEAWSDVRAFDGTASIIQPLIAPLYVGISEHELMAMILGQPDVGGYEIVRGYWQAQRDDEDDFEQWWQRALKLGLIPGTARPPIDPGAPKIPNNINRLAQAKAAGAALTVLFRPDYTVWDGTFANNPWLQELPKPFTKLTWDNAALLSPRLADKLDLRENDVVRLSFRGRQVEAPIMVLPGMADDAVGLHLGYGRPRAGNIGSLVLGDWPIGGFNAYALRTTEARWFGDGLEITKTGRQYPLVTTRQHHAMAALPGLDRIIENDVLKPDAITSQDTPRESLLDNRRLVRVGTIGEFRANPDFAKDPFGEEVREPLLSLYPHGNGAWEYVEGYQWGMSIDMTTCIGCNACVIACQAENNIPVVGKREVHRQREMHWIRIDDYFGGSLDDPHVHHQPVPCMHCENAPCEYVCPTGATTHSSEGINQMTYNRCVGTRYCSNNCPYKVRRFNFLSYAQAETTAPRKLQRNPEVTVRTNGVMEKCTYCIQRIQRTRIDAETKLVDLLERARAAGSEEEQRRLKDEARRLEFALIDSLQTACQQACPTNAIVFGSIRPVAGLKTKVAALKEQPHDYVLLRELTTKPRTSYLAHLSNPNAALASKGEGAST